MAKYTNKQKLKEQEENQLILEFCSVISSLNKLEDAALFIRDLVSKPELRMLAKRLKIAKMLIEGRTYKDVSEELNVSMGTIAKINLWLIQSGEGYRKAVKKMGSLKELEKPTWHGIKRKYPMYFWPEILLKEIIYSANKKQKERLKGIINSLDKKTALTKEIDLILHKTYNTTKY